MENLIEIKKIDRSILQILLMDRTTGKNIIWATDSYAHLGPAYERDKQIFIDQIWDTGIVEPRIQKALEVQKERTRKNAEVFTPAWICNQMNNQVEIDLLSPDSTFNTEISNGWETSKEQIRFRTKAGWKNYIRRRVLEITCGEAPFLVSRYDSSTGKTIPVGERIGLLDRKLRIAAENTKSAEEWFSWVLSGLKKTYGYEFQGDSLLLGRINIFLTVLENMNTYWNKYPELGQQKEIATIISWNLFQMDGLTDSTPIGVPEDRYIQPTLFDCFEKSQDENKIAASIKIDWWDKSKKILLRNMKEGKTMSKKFDVVIGNPPYQEETDSKSTRMPPVYHRFIDEARKIGNVVELITPARFLFNAGQTPKEWNKKMLNDEHVTVLTYEPNASTIFSNTDIKGGVAITYIDSAQKFMPIKTFIPYPPLKSILEKVRKVDGVLSLTAIADSSPTYDLKSLYKDHPSYRKYVADGGRHSQLKTNVLNINPIFTDSVKSVDDLIIFGLVNGKRGNKYINKKYIKENHGSTNKYKVLVPKASGSGHFGEALPNMLIAKPGEIFTQTYLSIGRFESYEEAVNLRVYLKTKFARALLYVLKITQDNLPGVWDAIPVQNFTNNSDIDWSKSIPEIDQQLYRKYNLSSEEIDFIDTHVKEME